MTESLISITYCFSGWFEDIYIYSFFICTWMKTRLIKYYSPHQLHGILRPIIFYHDLLFILKLNEAFFLLQWYVPSADTAKVANERR